MNILLVEPDFPIPTKSNNHKDFLPIGLLKIAALKTQEKHKVVLIRGNIDLVGINLTTKKQIGDLNYFNPDEIWITTLFTYWINYVSDSVKHYRNLFPNARIKVGGIAASLFGEEKTKDITKCDIVHLGVIPEAEELDTESLERAYDIYLNNDIDFQILHLQRGCFRRCKFCGTWIIEPKEKYESTVVNKIFKKNIVFYDNNFLRNPNIEAILEELIKLKRKRKIGWCESQSGFDGRLLLENPNLVSKLRLAGFRNIRIAWDGKYNEHKIIKKQVNTLVDGEISFPRKEIEIFMLYNWDISYNEMEKKRVKCFEWGVQISDCRYRPISQEFDNYNPRRYDQNENNYHINSNWTDILVKQFRKNVRRQNICVRHGFFFYSRELEQKRIPKKLIGEIIKCKNEDSQRHLLEKNKIDYWDPSKLYTETEVTDFVKKSRKLL